MRPRSLTHQLAWLYFACTGAVVLLGGLTTLALTWWVVGAADRRAPEELREALARRGSGLARVLAEGEPELARWLQAEAQLAWYLGEPGFQVLIAVTPETVRSQWGAWEGSPVLHLHVRESSRAGEDPRWEELVPLARGALQGENLQGWLAPGRPYAAAVPSFESGDDSAAPGVVLLSMDIPPAAHYWVRIAGLISALAAALLLLILVVGYVFSRWASRRLGRRLQEFDEILGEWAVDDFRQRLPVEPKDEVGGLGGRLNGLASSLERLRDEKVMREEERIRNSVAQELHDGAKQELFATAAALSGLRVRAARGEPVSAQDLEDLARSLEAGRLEVAAVISGMPLEAAPLAEVPARLREHAQRYAAAHGLELGWSASTSTEEEGCLDPLAMRFLQDCQRELLSNVARHSGARRVEVQFAMGGERMTLRVHDDGCGFPAERSSPEGMGLAGLSRRAEGWGGSLAVESSAGHGGACVVVEIVPPVPPSAARIRA